MRLRSLLFVPGDRPDRMEKALSSGADAVILDLEDSVLADNKPRAREAVGALLSRQDRDVPLLVRINPLGSPHLAEDLATVTSTMPDGIVLPKAEGAASVAQLSSMPGMGAFMTLPIATETARSIFKLETRINLARLVI